MKAQTIRNTPEQRRLIANLMATRRALWAHDGRAAWMFFAFREGMTTRAYVDLFARGLHSTGPGYTCADRAAPFLRGPEVVDESAQLALELEEVTR